MAATNFTPIILYHSVTASAAPTAGNLNNGELAINITDGKLFYKDNGGVVQIIATKGTGVIGGSNNQVQYNSSGALAGSANFTFDGTTATINTLNLTTVLDETYGGTGLTSYTTGDVIYASGSNTLAKLAIGANTYILTSTGSVPQWSAPSAVSVSTATNLAGGTAGAVPYQSGVGATTFLSIGTNNQVLTSTGSAPQWVSGLSLTTLSTSGNTTLGDAAADNLTINATVTSNLIFTDNTYDIGANGATRPRTIYVGTSVFSPLVDATNLEVTNIKALDGTAAASIANSTGVISVVKDAIINTITVGLGAGAVGTNTAVGVSALAANTTGAFNVAFGSQALSANTTGERNVSVGRQSMLLNTTGGYNVAVGMNTLEQNTTASYNVAVGYTALQVNTTGANNTAIGTNALVANTTASYNTAVGYQSLYANTTGRNTGLGAFSLFVNTTGTNNSGIGDNALQANTTGSYNTAVGFQSLSGNTTASNNTAVGYQAAYSNTTGSVTAVGAGAGYANTTGQYNTYLGDLAGRTASTANSNTGVGYNALRFSTAGGHTAVGESALYANTTGTNSVAVGAGALQANTTASNNTAVGYQAGYSNTTGAFNLFVGRIAGYSNTTASAVTAVGNGAAYANTTGTDTTAVGSNALVANTTGAYNTALGSQSLYSNTTASNNTAVGYQAGYSVQTGLYNTFMGYQAGYNTTNQYNTFIGNQAGYSNGSGYRNTAVGAGAGYSNISSIYNTFLGEQSGYSTTGGSNTFVGYAAGYNTTSGTTNAFLGTGAGSAITSGSKNTVVGSFNGNQGGLDIRTANNYIVLSDGDGNPRQYWNGTVWTLGSTRRTVVGDAFVGDNSTNGNNRSIIFGSGGLIPGDGSGTSSDAAYDLGIAGNRWAVARVTGVNFPATQVASSDANTLDDYEEGTWTPGFAFNAGATGITYTVQAGKYTKIGNSVTCTGRIVLSNKGSSTGVATLTGFPFAAGSGNEDFSAASILPDTITYTGSLLAINTNSATTIRLYSVTEAGVATQLTDANFSNSSQIIVTITYLID